MNGRLKFCSIGFPAVTLILAVTLISLNGLSEQKTSHKASSRKSASQMGASQMDASQMSTLQMGTSQKSFLPKNSQQKSALQKSAQQESTFQKANEQLEITPSMMDVRMETPAVKGGGNDSGSGSSQTQSAGSSFAIQYLLFLETYQARGQFQQPGVQTYDYKDLGTLWLPSVELRWGIESGARALGLETTTASLGGFVSLAYNSHVMTVRSPTGLLFEDTTLSSLWLRAGLTLERPLLSLPQWSWGGQLGLAKYYEVQSSSSAYARNAIQSGAVEMTLLAKRQWFLVGLKYRYALMGNSMDLGIAPWGIQMGVSLNEGQKFQ